MSKTKDIAVTVTCDTEEEFDAIVEAILEVVGPVSGALSGTAWDATPDDELPPGDGQPPSDF